MRPSRFVAVALVPLFACFGSSTGSPGADGGVDAAGTDALAPVEAGAETSTPCPTPTGAGTMHGGSVAQAETWTAAGSPYLLPYDTEITAALTLEACTVVNIGAGKTITVATGGSIVAGGTSTRPVTLQRKDAANWASIRAMGGGTLSFTGVIVDGGGDPLNSVPEYAAALDLRADLSKPPADVLTASAVQITGSMSQGIYMHESGAISASSSDLTIRGAKGYPIHASANLAGTIPVGTYTGNGADEILLSGSGAGLSIASWDVTFANHGVPYHVGTPSEEGRLDVGGMPPAKATLTVAAGVTMRFKKGGALYVDYSHGTSPAAGALIAVGTPQKPILFTSAETASVAGDWLGLNFGEVPDPTDRLDFVIVEYAGGASTSGSSSCPYPGAPAPPSDAAIRLYGPPASAFITNSSISDSASNGIDRGWAANNLTDFLADGTNTFVSVARCRQTYPKNANNGGCPSPVPCP